MSRFVSVSPENPTQQRHELKHEESRLVLSVHLLLERLMGGRGFDSEQVNPGERSASVFISPVNLNQSHTERLKEKNP